MNKITKFCLIGAIGCFISAIVGCCCMMDHVKNDFSPHIGKFIVAAVVLFISALVFSEE